MISHEDTKMLAPDRLESLARIVVECGFNLHRDLGPGLLETAYEAILFELLIEQGIRVERQVPVPIRYRHIHVENAFRIDLLIEGNLVVELKSVEKLAPVHGKQLLTYLRLMNAPLGLLMNFGQATLKDGLRRIANNYYGPIAKR
jgi:GxxExxY protein